MKRRYLIAALCMSAMLVVGVGCKAKETTSTSGTTTTKATTEATVEPSEETEEPTTETTQKVSTKAVQPTPTPTPVAGLTKMEYINERSDGSKYLVRTYYYDDGVLMKEESADGYTVEYSYNTDGTISVANGRMEENRYGESATWTETYTYGDNGLLAQKVKTYDIVYEDEFGIQRIETVTTTDYTYDEDGFILEEKHIETSKNLDAFTSSYRIEYEYDDNGCLLKVTTYDIAANGTEEINRYTEYTCDEKGVILQSLETILGKSYGVEPEIEFYEYDDAGRLKRKSISDGELVYFYDEQGLLTRIEDTRYGMNDAIIYEYTF